MKSMPELLKPCSSRPRRSRREPQRQDDFHHESFDNWASWWARELFISVSNLLLLLQTQASTVVPLCKFPSQVQVKSSPAQSSPGQDQFILNKSVPQSCASLLSLVKARCIGPADIIVPLRAWISGCLYMTAGSCLTTLATWADKVAFNGFTASNGLLKSP